MTEIDRHLQLVELSIRRKFRDLKRVCLHGSLFLLDVVSQGLERVWSLSFSSQCRWNNDEFLFGVAQCFCLLLLLDLLVEQLIQLCLVLSDSVGFMLRSALWF